MLIANQTRKHIQSTSRFPLWTSQIVKVFGLWVNHMCKILASARAPHFNQRTHWEGDFCKYLSCIIPARNQVAEVFRNNTIPIDSEARIIILCKNYRWSTCSFTKTHHKAVFSPTVVVKYLGQRLPHSNRSESNTRDITFAHMMLHCILYHHWENYDSWPSLDLSLSLIDKQRTPEIWLNTERSNT